MSPEITVSHEAPFVTEKTWPNGFKLILHEMPHVATVAGRLSVKAGPYYEFPQLVGSSHFIEHWGPDGTRNFSSYRELENAVESRGGEQEEQTNFAWVAYDAKLPVEHRDHLIPFLFEHVDKPRFRTRDLKIEKKIVPEEILEEIDHPEKYATNLLFQHLWRRHPVGIGFGPLGTIESIQSFNKEALINEYQRLWRPDNMVLVAAGNIDREQIVGQIEKTFGRLKRPESQIEILPAPSYARENGRVHIRSKRLKQVQILLAFSLEPSLIQDNHLRIELLNKLLDKNVRHSLIHTFGRGYKAEVDTEEIYTDFGTIFVTASVSSRRAERAVDEIIRQVNILKLTDENILIEKESLKGKKTLNLEGPEKMTEYIAEEAVQGKTVLSPKELKKEIDDITLESLERVREQIFTNNNAVLVLLGSISEQKAPYFDQKLQFGR